jgi:hypothetical protein
VTPIDGAAAATPVPVSEMETFGWLGSLLAMVREPLAVLACVGAKRTVTVADVPAATVKEAAVLRAKPGPATVAALTFSVADPVLERVKDWSCVWPTVPIGNSVLFEKMAVIRC